MKNNYISMWEASKICSYSQEYLSLMARRKLIKAVKMDNKWFTKAIWISEYLKDKKPEEIVLDNTNNTQQTEPAKKREFNYFWLFFGISALFLVMFVWFYQKMDSKITKLEKEAKNAQTEYSVKKTEYPFTLPGFSDFFAPEKLEF